MDSGIPAWIMPVALLVGGAIGWLSSQYWQHRRAKRQAADDASKILNEKKKLLTELISDTKKVKQREELTAQLEEVNAALLGLHSERLRSNLKDAGLPPEAALIADGLSQLKPQQVTKLKEEVAAVESLPLSDSIPDLLTLANAYYYSGQYQDAKDIYDKILDLNPNDPVALYNRGITYDELERYDEALADYNRSLELRPDNPNTLYNRGNTYHKLGKYDKALADFNRSLEFKPDDPDALCYRGITYSKLERYDEAIADFNRSLELKPDYTRSIYNLACLFSLWRKPKDALAHLEKAITLDKKCREDAKTDEDFGNIRDDPRFKKLVGK